MPIARAKAKPNPPAEAATAPHLNEVRLVGRLAAEPVLRELPSGDILVQFRLIVERVPILNNSGGSRATVDTLECVAWRKDVQRSLRSCVAGDVLAVEGALRRRFWRAGAGAVSRSEVEARKVRRQGKRAT